MIDLKKGLLQSFGYRVNQKLFLIPFLLAYGLILFAGFKYGFGVHSSFLCPKDSPGYCDNPYSFSCDSPSFSGNNCFPSSVRNRFCSANTQMCRMEKLPPGWVVNGSPPFLVSLLPVVIFLSLLIPAVINHFLYNRDFMKGSLMKSVDERMKKEFDEEEDDGE